jgi:hypothetical protein
MKKILLFLVTLICFCGCSKNQELEQTTIDPLLLIGTWEELSPMEYSQRYTFYEGGIYGETFTGLSDELYGESTFKDGFYSVYGDVISLNGKNRYKVVKLSDTEMIWEMEESTTREYISLSRVISEYEEHEFHDGYYLYQGEKIHLTPIEDEYTIVFRTEDINEVLTFLEKNSWEILLSGPAEHPWQLWNGNFEGVYDFLKYSMVAQIKGSGDIDKIPHVYFSHNGYVSQNGIHLYPSNKVYVKYYDKESYGDRLTEALEYARKLQITPVYITDYEDSKYVTFLCTNNSAGNPLELANWFCEEKGFVTAEPDLWGNGGWD